MKCRVHPLIIVVLLGVLAASWMHRAENAQSPASSSAPYEKFAVNAQDGAQPRREMKGPSAANSRDMSHAARSRPSVMLRSAASAMPAGSVPGDMDALHGNTEEYDRITENQMLETAANPVSTFSIDVDTASYANVRRFIRGGQRPYPDAVRVEELINYFTYDYPNPEGDVPFSFTTEVSHCPWSPGTKLLHIGLQGRRVAFDDAPPNNLVFLIDVSGSMNNANKLPLLISAFKLLVNEMREQDRAAITVYAGAAGLVLPPTSGADKQTIVAALDKLRAGGSTAGGAGIKLAYSTAREHFDPEGNNRVILATDGDFNVGLSSDAELVRMIEKEREAGVFLSVLGFGSGNYKDSKMEKLADKGNGNYAYIDSITEAKKVLVTEMGSTLLTIAKDVKVQIEFNPAKVKSYRLVGYENRMLKKEDFDDDTKDAGELGAGHTVTALYEIVPQTGPPSKEVLRYQQTTPREGPQMKDELAFLKFRYKAPEGKKSRLVTHPIADSDVRLGDASDNLKFSSAVAAWGLILRDSENKGTASIDLVRELAGDAAGRDPFGYRAEFLELVEASAKLVKAN